MPAGAGHRISFRQAGEIVGQQAGRPLRPLSLGSEADLRQAMAAADPQKKVMLAYLLSMTNGQTALSDLRTTATPTCGSRASLTSPRACWRRRLQPEPTHWSRPGWARPPAARGH